MPHTFSHLLYCKCLYYYQYYCDWCIVLCLYIHLCICQCFSGGASGPHRARSRCRRDVHRRGGPGETTSHAQHLGWVDSIPVHRGAILLFIQNVIKGRLLAFQGVLGGVETVDTAAFETIWSSIKEKYLSEVTVWVFGPSEHWFIAVCVLSALNAVNRGKL